MVLPRSRNVISTVLALRRRNRGSNPASASASCSTARFGPDGRRPPGFCTLRPLLIRHSRNLILRMPRTWPWAQEFADALNRVRAIP